MNDHLVIDIGRYPPQIRCTHCGAAQDLKLPIPVTQLVSLERDWAQHHGRCIKPQSP